MAAIAPDNLKLSAAVRRMNLKLDRKGSRVVCVAMTAGLLIAGLWPFAFLPYNRVTWLGERPGLRFQPSGMAYDPEPLEPELTGSLANPATFTVELWLAARLEPDNDVFHVLTLHGGRLPSDFVLCQWKSSLLLRCPRLDGERGHREVGVRDALPKRKARLVTITGDASGVAFYLDGALVRHFPSFVVPAQALRGQLVLGDSAGGKHAWSGELSGVALFTRALTAAEVASHQETWLNGHAERLTAELGLEALYLFDESGGRWARDRSPQKHRLEIPTRYRVLQQQILSLPWSEGELTRADLKDFLLNIAGFVPFGVLVCHRRRLLGGGWLINVLTAVFAGASISLLIELLQVWLPARSSSGTDVLCNIAGVALGALAVRGIAAAFHTDRRSEQTDLGHGIP